MTTLIDNANVEYNSLLLRLTENLNPLRRRSFAEAKALRIEAASCVLGLRQLADRLEAEYLEKE